MSNGEIPGIPEGTTLADYEDAEGNIWFPVDQATLENAETPPYTAGSAGVAPEDLGVVASGNREGDGNRAWEEAAGEIVMRSPNDVGKRVWIRVIGQAARWTGPWIVVDSVDPARFIQWSQDGKVLEVDRNDAGKIGIVDASKGARVEVAWQSEAPGGDEGPADNILYGEMSADPSGAAMGYMGGASANRSPGFGDVWRTGMNAGTLARLTGQSAAAAESFMSGQPGAPGGIGGNVVGGVGSAVAERAAWRTHEFKERTRYQGAAYDDAMSRGQPYSPWGGGAPPPLPPRDPDADVYWPYGEEFLSDYETGEWIEGEGGGPGRYEKSSGIITMLYELQMAGLPQSEIEAFAEQNGLDFAQAVEQLHRDTRVDERWPTNLSWYSQIAASRGYIDEGGQFHYRPTDLATAWAEAGVSQATIDAIAMYGEPEIVGGVEGSLEHWLRDYKLGLTDEDYEDWSYTRYVMNHEEGYGYGGERGIEVGVPYDIEAVKRLLAYEAREDYVDADGVVTPWEDIEFNGPGLSTESQQDLAEQLNSEMIDTDWWGDTGADAHEPSAVAESEGEPESEAQSEPVDEEEEAAAEESEPVEEEEEGSEELDYEEELKEEEEEWIDDEDVPFDVEWFAEPEPEPEPEPVKPPSWLEEEYKPEPEPDPGEPPPDIGWMEDPGYSWGGVPEKEKPPSWFNF